MTHATTRATSGAAPGAVDPDAVAMLRSMSQAAAFLKRLPAGDTLDPPGVYLLDLLVRCGPTRPSDLAVRTGLDQSTISRKLRSLGDLGYVARTPDPLDGRAAVVAPTTSGIAALEHSLAHRAGLLADAVRDWAPADRRALGTLLARLADDLGAAHHPPIHQESS